MDLTVNTRMRSLIALFGAAVLVAALLAIATPRAHAASVAACDEYLVINCGNGGGGEPTGGGGGGGGHELGSGFLGGHGSASGQLPFTGYPLTPLVLLFLALLVAGVLIRVGVEIRKRIGTRHASATG